MDLVLVAVAAATVNNFVLVRLLGLSPLLDPGSEPVELPATALAITAVLTLTLGLCYSLEHWVLVAYGVPYLRILGFLGITLAVTAAANLILARQGRRLPLVTSACVIVGVALLTVSTANSLATAVTLGFGAGAGFSLVMLLFNGLHRRLEQAPVPLALRGPAITLLTAGMLGLALLGFTGLGT